MKQRLLIVVVVLFIVVVGVNVLVKHYVTGLKAETSQMLPVVRNVTAASTPVVSAGKRQPDDPSRYGIVTLEPGEAPSTQEEWNRALTKTFDDRKVFDTPAGRMALDKMKMNPVEYKEIMVNLENEIKKIEQKSGNDPTNKDLKQRKENLYMLKALSGVLEENGLVDPSVPYTP